MVTAIGLSWGIDKKGKSIENVLVKNDAFINRAVVSTI